MPHGSVSASRAKPLLRMIGVELGGRPHTVLQNGVVDVNAGHPVPVDGEAVPYVFDL
jgi:hypothetical protein